MENRSPQMETVPPSKQPRKVGTAHPGPVLCQAALPRSHPPQLHLPIQPNRKCRVLLHTLLHILMMLQLLPSSTPSVQQTLLAHSECFKNYSQLNQRASQHPRQQLLIPGSLPLNQPSSPWNKSKIPLRNDSQPLNLLLRILVRESNHWNPLPGNQMQEAPLPASDPTFQQQQVQAPLHLASSPFHAYSHSNAIQL